MKVIVVLGMAFMLLAIEDWLSDIISISGLLAIMSMALMIAMKSVPEVTNRLQEKYGKLWIAAEVILFVLVGAAVDIRYTLEAGIGAVLMIGIGSVPLSLGLPCGNLVLSVAVLSILITAPLGAIGMDISYKRLLKQDG